VTDKPFFPMNIKEIVDQALHDGYLTPAMEAEVGRICDSAAELSVEEYMALDRLMGALLAAEVVTVPRKQFINVMEELVLTEAIRQVAILETNQAEAGTAEPRLDVGDVAAYALNRLPPLYATSEEGAKYQRERAKSEMQAIIRQQVEEGIERNIDRPDFFPERQAIVRPQPGKEMVDQVSSLLQAYTPGSEMGQTNGKEEHN
jgi:Late competence development protein ComFB